MQSIWPFNTGQDGSREKVAEVTSEEGRPSVQDPPPKNCQKTSLEGRILQVAEFAQETLANWHNRVTEVYLYVKEWVDIINCVSFLLRNNLDFGSPHVYEIATRLYTHPPISHLVRTKQQTSLITFISSATHWNPCDATCSQCFTELGSALPSAVRDGGRGQNLC